MCGGGGGVREFGGVGRLWGGCGGGGGVGGGVGGAESRTPNAGGHQSGRESHFSPSIDYRSILDSCARGKGLTLSARRKVRGGDTRGWKS